MQQPIKLLLITMVCASLPVALEAAAGSAGTTQEEAPPPSRPIPTKHPRSAAERWNMLYYGSQNRSPVPEAGSVSLEPITSSDAPAKTAATSPLSSSIAAGSTSSSASK